MAESQKTRVKGHPVVGAGLGGRLGVIGIARNVNDACYQLAVLSLHALTVFSTYLCEGFWG